MFGSVDEGWTAFTAQGFWRLIGLSYLLGWRAKRVVGEIAPSETPGAAVVFASVEDSPRRALLGA
jgi:hypothetical protein